MENLQIIAIPALSDSSAARKYCHEIEWTVTEIGLTRRQITPHYIAIDRDMESRPFGIWLVEVIIEEEVQIAKTQGRSVFRIDEQADYKRL